MCPTAKCGQCYNFVCKIMDGLNICNTCYWKNINTEKDFNRIWEDMWGETWVKQNIGRY